MKLKIPRLQPFIAFLLTTSADISHPSQNRRQKIARHSKTQLMFGCCFYSSCYRSFYLQKLFVMCMSGQAFQGAYKCRQPDGITFMTQQ